MFTVRLLVSVVLFLAEGIFEVLRSVGNLEELEEDNGPRKLDTQTAKFKLHCGYEKKAFFQL